MSEHKKKGLIMTDKIDNLSVKYPTLNRKAIVDIFLQGYDAYYEVICDISINHRVQK